MEVSQIPYIRIETTSAKNGVIFVEQSCKEQISDSKSFLGILPQKLSARTSFFLKYSERWALNVHRQGMYSIVGFQQIQQAKFFLL